MILSIDTSKFIDIFEYLHGKIEIKTKGNGGGGWSASASAPGTIIQKPEKSIPVSRIRPTFRIDLTLHQA